jgi:hypothetical protein
MIVFHYDIGHVHDFSAYRHFMGLVSAGTQNGTTPCDYTGEVCIIEFNKPILHQSTVPIKVTDQGVSTLM